MGIYGKKRPEILKLQFLLEDDENGLELGVPYFQTNPDVDVA